jgi:hypothetical protein
MWKGTGDAWLPDHHLYRRASGRRRVNALRRFRATAWRCLVFDMWWHQGLSQAAIARHLGVHRSTVSRDVMALYLALQAGPGVTMGQALWNVPPRREW